MTADEIEVAERINDRAVEVAKEAQRGGKGEVKPGE